MALKNLPAEKIEEILEEIIVEQQISPFINPDGLKNYIKEGVHFLNNAAHTNVDYDEDLNARSLLKTYVLYANHKRLAEWKELYQSEYIRLQEFYYINSDIS